MSRPGRAADTNKVSRCTCAGSWHSEMTCACSSCKTWCCVSHKRYSRQARWSVARRESLCLHHKCMLGTLSRRRNCCIRHKRMLSTLQKRKACPFTASARAHLLDVPCHPKSDEMLVRRVQAQACLPTSAAVPKLNAVRAQRHCHRSLTRTCIQSVPRICIPPWAAWTQCLRNVFKRELACGCYHKRISETHFRRQHVCAFGYRHTSGTLSRQRLSCPSTTLQSRNRGTQVHRLLWEGETNLNSTTQTVNYGIAQQTNLARKVMGPNLVFTLNALILVRV